MEMAPESFLSFGFVCVRGRSSQLWRKRLVDDKHDFGTVALLMHHRPGCAGC